ncbi:MAG: aspartyl/glutamyl-tRNA amidotransferase subunit C [Candidatus Nanoarchaeia archaeon]
MNVDEALIEKVASNARLNLTDEEKKRYVPQFKEILESFCNLVYFFFGKTKK